MFGNRPDSLKKVVEFSEKGLDIDALLREFLDKFYIEKNTSIKENMIQEKPMITSNDNANAYLGAVAEHLARLYELQVPSWSEHSDRFLKKAFFPCGLESLKATLIMESPIAFRRRLIFVDKNPLYRPRKDIEVL